MGVFISVNGWSKHVIELTKQNPEKKILLVDGEDVEHVLAGKVTFAELLGAKSRALHTLAEPFKGYQDLFPQT
ncbi:MAG: hypothetical protein OXR67_03400 [Chloroflexota bacterium]|nr:hypothetical protein [Chloroflexota bacterium]